MHARRPTDPRIQPVEKVRERLQERAAEMGSPMLAFNVGATMAHHRTMRDLCGAFTSGVLGSLTVEPRHRELVILRAGWNCGAEYEFGQHTLAARDVGIPDQDILDLTRPLDMGRWTEAERVLLRMVDELYVDDVITDDSWDALHQHFTGNAVTEFVVLFYVYRMVSGLLNVWGTELDPGVPGWPRARPAP